MWQRALCSCFAAPVQSINCEVFEIKRVWEYSLHLTLSCCSSLSAKCLWIIWQTWRRRRLLSWKFSSLAQQNWMGAFWDLRYIFGRLKVWHIERNGTQKQQGAIGICDSQIGVWYWLVKKKILRCHRGKRAAGLWRPLDHFRGKAWTDFLRSADNDVQAQGGAIFDSHRKMQESLNSTWKRMNQWIVSHSHWRGMLQ